MLTKVQLPTFTPPYLILFSFFLLLTKAISQKPSGSTIIFTTTIQTIGTIRHAEPQIPTICPRGLYSTSSQSQPQKWARTKRIILEDFSVAILVHLILNISFFCHPTAYHVYQAFIMWVNKWLILKKPLAYNLHQTTIIIIACEILHNFCINSMYRLLWIQT